MSSSQPDSEKIRQFLAPLSDDDLRELAAWFAAGQPGMVQLNASNSKAFQVHVAGGTAYIGDHYSISTNALKQVLEKLINPKLTIGIPQNLPYIGVAEFVGRQAELERLYQQLQPGSPVVISAVSGMGGIGKTELALEYARQQHRAEAYPGGICWIKAREDAGNRIISFARSQLNLTPPDDLELEEKVHWCWSHWQEGAVLLILDDVQDYAEVRSFLPPTESRFRVLMTTRSHFGAPVQEVQLDVLSEVEALKLLRVQVQDNRVDQQLEQAKQLCEWLGYLPLGIELVGRYLAEDKDLSLQDLWQELQDERIEAEALKQVEEGMTASLGVLAAFELSWQKLTVEAQELVAVLSLFALVEIPWELVQRCLPEVNEAVLKKLRNKQLLKLNLLKRVDEGTYQLHQLLREFFAVKRSQRIDDAALQRQFYQVVIAETERVSEKPERSLIKESMIMIAHLQAAIDQLATPEQALDLSTCLHWIANLYYLQGRYEKAENSYLQALEIRKQLLGTKDLDVATSLNNLAGVYELQGRYTEAEALYLQIRLIREEKLKANHPEIASSLNNLAGVYESQGRYGEAELLYLKALESRRLQLDNRHPDVAQSLNNLAHLYVKQGRYSEAEPLYLEALESRRLQLDNRHPDVAQSLNNLAHLYVKQGRYSEAEPLYLEALEVLREGLGEKHPHVANPLNNLGLLYASLNRYSEAESRYLEALEILREGLGEKHPHVGNLFNNLGLLYASLNHYLKAEKFYLEALGILKKKLGDNHPNVGNVLNNLGELYLSQIPCQSDFYQKRLLFSRAEELYCQAYEAMKLSLGIENPATQAIQNKISVIREFLYLR